MVASSDRSINEHPPRSKDRMGRAGGKASEQGQGRTAPAPPAQPRLLSPHLSQLNWPRSATVTSSSGCAHSSPLAQEVTSYTLIHGFIGRSDSTLLLCSSTADNKGALIDSHPICFPPFLSQSIYFFYVTRTGPCSGKFIVLLCIRFSQANWGQTHILFTHRGFNCTNKKIPNNRKCYRCGGCGDRSGGGDKAWDKKRRKRCNEINCFKTRNAIPPYFSFADKLYRVVLTHCLVRPPP